MVRPSKRRKIRNPSSKVSRRSKNPYKISFAGAHPLIQQKWDRKLTLRQNYEKMGLVASLNGLTGGDGTPDQRVSKEKEITEEDDDDEMEAEEEEADGDDEDFVIEYRSMEDFEKMPAVVGRRTRSTNDDEDDEEDENDGLFEPIEPEIKTDPRAKRIGIHIGLKDKNLTKKPKQKKSTKGEAVEGEGSIVALMEAEAALGEAPRERHASDQEGMVLKALVKKYGDNVEGMARDIKLNKYQLTAGQLKKKLKTFNKK
ncbi:Nucleolar protein 16 [Blyttiomyces sp. JEL0837]|nr:Nucleolar protein 16 [Blyttiomyces sp. JEL0837]